MSLSNIHDKQATQTFSPTFISLDIKNPPGIDYKVLPNCPL